MATDPSTAGTVLRRVHLSAASPRHILTVVLLSTGHVEHRLIDVDAAVTDASLTMAANYINREAADRDLEDVSRLGSVLDVAPELHAHAALIAKVWSSIRQMAASLIDRRVYLEGTNCLLRQPEFQDVQRLHNLMSALQPHSELWHALGRLLQQSGNTIIIGGENDLPTMQDCSVVTTTYWISGRPAGYLGVIGPTRMNYDRAVAAVGLMANNLSLLLTNLSLA